MLFSKENMAQWEDAIQRYNNNEGVGRATDLGVRWEDLRVPVTSTKKGGTKDPDFAVFKTNGAGSQGVFLEWFDKTLEEELYFSVQLPHKYKLGTDLHPHIHWVPKAESGIGQACAWGLEYTWTDIHKVFGNTVIIGVNIAAEQPSPWLRIDTHYVTALPAITPPSGVSISSMLVCRLFRDATSSLNTDNFAQDAGLLEFDFHYQIDDRGSLEEYSKN